MRGARRAGAGLRPQPFRHRAAARPGRARRLRVRRAGRGGRGWRDGPMLAGSGRRRSARRREGRREGALRARGDRIVHGDLRADNKVRDHHLGVTFVDWAHATTGPACTDAASLAPQLVLAGHTPASIAPSWTNTPPPPPAPRRPPRSSPHSPDTGTATPDCPHPRRPGLRPYQHRAAAAGLTVLNYRLS
ncbi:phosphotransferase [Streptomyces sp. NPDC059783]|uniref:phosphotransferase n=1 Tax=Streptomyces sp. NPDC059783 TaxID=3346944 RepID=UPI00365B233F